MAKKKGNFFENLKSFSDFNAIASSHRYQQVPDDWYVVVSDIIGSTRAIDEGRYKDVNTIGAASIASVQNAVPGYQFPYVFGGDGASFVIPGDALAAVSAALGHLAHLAENNYNLSLRLGAVPIHELRKKGGPVEVAKFELFAGKCVATFRGGGLSLAEAWIKEQPEIYGLQTGESPTADLNGLSCRWSAIRSQQGSILSLLVEARDQEAADIYSEVLEELHHIFEGELTRANPVNITGASYYSIRQCINEEIKYYPSPYRTLSFYLRCIEICAAVAVFKFKIPPLFFNPSKYQRAMEVSSDYRKFDDRLRMVIDCTPQQAAKIRDYLEVCYQKKKLFYGIHESSTSLMTCLVESVADGKHIHFVDGGDGGYAMAAKQLKEQLAEAK